MGTWAQVGLSAGALVDAGGVTWPLSALSAGALLKVGATTVDPLAGSVAGSTPVWLVGTGFVDSSRAWAYGVTSTATQVLENTTAAALGAQQVSPGLAMLGRGRETTGGTSQTVGAMIDCLPVQGATCTAAMQWKFKTSTAGAWGASVMTLTSAGDLTLPLTVYAGAFVASGNFRIGTSYWRNLSAAGLGLCLVFESSTSTDPIQLLHRARTDGAGNVVVSSCYVKGSAITNAATMRLHQFSVVLDAVPTNTEVGSFRCNGDLYVHGRTRGQNLGFLSGEPELLTIAAGGVTSTCTAGGVIPAGAVLLGVSWRVDTVIPALATVFSVGVGGDTARFATGQLVAAGTSGFRCLPPIEYAAATPVIITTDANPAANTGRVLITVHYYIATAPTS